MFVFIFLLALPFCYGEEIDLHIEPSRLYRLEPKDLTGTTWHMKTVEGSKLAVYCTLLVKDCKQVSLRSGFKNQYMSPFCNDKQLELNTAVSIKNELSISIATKGNEIPAYCNVTAPPAYLNVKEPESFDSSEEGTVKGTTPTCPCGWRNKDSSRIINGEETKVNEYPFIVAFGIKGQRPFCGGTIVTPYHVITAAHCYNDSIPVDDHMVIVGAHNLKDDKDNKNRKEISVQKIVNHEEYSRDSLKSDIAIVTLKEKIEFSKFVGPMCMPKAGRNLVDEYIKVIGWGYTERGLRDVLMSVHLRVVDPKVCNAIFNKNFVSKICTYTERKDICQGDSGGPLFKVNPETNMYTQYGVVSFGAGCGDNNPSAFTELFPYMDWIKQKIQETIPQELCY